jgi:hypothetical protein
VFKTVGQDIPLTDYRRSVPNAARNVSTAASTSAVTSCAVGSPT